MEQRSCTGSFDPRSHSSRRLLLLGSLRGQVSDVPQASPSRTANSVFDPCDYLHLRRELLQYTNVLANDGVVSK